MKNLFSNELKMVYFVDERLAELSSDHVWKGRKLPGKSKIILFNILKTEINTQIIDENFDLTNTKLFPLSAELL